MRNRIGAAVALAALLALAIPGVAAAARPDGSDFACRAAGLRVGLLGGALGAPVEAIVANSPGRPCTTQSNNTVPAQSVGGLAGAQAALSDTNQTPADISQAPPGEGQGAAATSRIADLSVGSGNPLNPLAAVNAQVLNSAAAIQCRSGQPSILTSGNVVGLTVLGIPINIPDPTKVNQTIPLGSLGSIVLNEEQRTATSVIRRALHITINGVADVVVAESVVGFSGNPCAAAAATKPQCSDGRDNDGDGKIDAADPGCHSDSNPNNPKSYNANDNSEADQPQCSNGRDDDGDGLIDYPKDRGCSSARDNSERTASGRPGRLITSPSSVGRLGLRVCTARSFIARVIQARSVDHVNFRLDGRLLTRDRHAPFMAYVNRHRLTHRRHVLTATVVFLRDAHTRARTLRLHFRGCAGPAGPRFTG